MSGHRRRCSAYSRRKATLGTPSGDRTLGRRCRSRSRCRGSRSWGRCRGSCSWGWGGLRGWCWSGGRRCLGRRCSSCLGDDRGSSRCRLSRRGGGDYARGSLLAPCRCWGRSGGGGRVLLGRSGSSRLLRFGLGRGRHGCSRRGRGWSRCRCSGRCHNRCCRCKGCRRCPRRCSCVKIELRREREERKLAEGGSDTKVREMCRDNTSILNAYA